MAKRDCSAVDIGSIGMDAELAHACDRLRGKGFVDLDHIHVLDAQAGTRKCLAGRVYRPHPHDFGFKARNCSRPYTGEHVEPMLSRECFRRDEYGNGAIRQRRGSTSRDGTAFPERRFQRGEPFERSLRTQTKIAIDHGAVGRDNRHELIVQTTFGLRT